jgi:secreted PhoX family phosphatase
MGRRNFLALGVGAATALTLGSGFWRDVLEAGNAPVRRPGRGYGPLARPDANGIRLPAGFRSRVVARGGQEVADSGYRWHQASDGAATFPTSLGGWILVSNSESLRGGASAIRFDREGRVEDAYRILGGTSQNCSGGGTPWGTWLSCEEIEDGRVWECDPAGRRKPVVRPAMGVFKHEAAALDHAGGRVYMTEDLIDGGFYRFTPARRHDLGAGRLEIAQVGKTGRVRWTEVPDPAARDRPTREQVAGSTPFARAEGIWFDAGKVYLATTADSRVHSYDTESERIEVVYDGLASREAPLLRVDALTGSPAGELFVCEDLATEEIDIGLVTRGGEVSRFLSVTGSDHRGSELTGAAFDPSGARLYFSSQRARGTGAVYEVRGPFRSADGFSSGVPAATPRP